MVSLASMVRMPKPAVVSIGRSAGLLLGFSLVLVLFAGVRERLAVSKVPAAFAGAPISFMTAGLLALAFMGFAGLQLG